MSSLYKLQVRSPADPRTQPLFKAALSERRQSCKTTIFFGFFFSFLSERRSYFGTPRSSWCAGEHI